MTELWNCDYSTGLLTEDGGASGNAGDSSAAPAVGSSTPSPFIGGYYAEFTPGTNPAGGSYRQRDLGSNLSEVWGLIVFRVRTIGDTRASVRILDFEDASASQVQIAVNCITGVMEAWKGTSTSGSVLETGTQKCYLDAWNVLKFYAKIDSSAGRIQAYLNGSETPCLDYTGNTQRTANAYTRKIAWGAAWGGGSTTRRAYVNQIAVDDAALPTYSGSYPSYDAVTVVSSTSGKVQDFGSGSLPADWFAVDYDESSMIPAVNLDPGWRTMPEGATEVGLQVDNLGGPNWIYRCTFQMNPGSDLPQGWIQIATDYYFEAAYLNGTEILTSHVECYASDGWILVDGALFVSGANVLALRIGNDTVQTSMAFRMAAYESPVRARLAFKLVVS